MGKRVVIDADECIGCESCVELFSEVFAFNEAEEKAAKIPVKLVFPLILFILPSLFVAIAVSAAVQLYRTLMHH